MDIFWAFSWWSWNLSVLESTVNCAPYSVQISLCALSLFAFLFPLSCTVLFPDPFQGLRALCTMHPLSFLSPAPISRAALLALWWPPGQIAFPTTRARLYLSLGVLLVTGTVSMVSKPEIRNRAVVSVRYLLRHSEQLPLHYRTMALLLASSDHIAKLSTDHALYQK